MFDTERAKLFLHMGACEERSTCGYVTDADCLKHSSHERVHLWRHNWEVCAVYCTFKLTANEDYLFNCLSMNTVLVCLLLCLQGHAPSRKLKRLVIGVVPHLHYILQGVTTFVEPNYSTGLLISWG